MILVFVAVFSVLAALGLGLAAAWSDFSKLTIPNNYSLAIIGAFIPAFLVLGIYAADTNYFGSWDSHLLAAGVVFVTTYALFHFNLLGGGDSKLMTAFALWVGLSGLVAFLFFMGIVGGLLAAATLLFGKYKPFKKFPKDGWLSKAQAGEKKVPYGIAIALGAIITFFNIGYIDPETVIALAEFSRS